MWYRAMIRAPGPGNAVLLYRAYTLIRVIRYTLGTAIGLAGAVLYCGCCCLWIIGLFVRARAMIKRVFEKFFPSRDRKEAVRL